MDGEGEWCGRGGGGGKGICSGGGGRAEVGAEVVQACEVEGGAEAGAEDGGESAAVEGAEGVGLGED